MKKNNKLQPIVSSDKKQIEGLIKGAMRDYLVYQSDMKVENTRNIETLVGMISEYLSAFIIIGYDVKRQPVNLIHAKNQMDADALSAAVNKFILHSVKNAE